MPCLVINLRIGPIPPDQPRSVWDSPAWSTSALPPGPLVRSPGATRRGSFVAAVVTVFRVAVGVEPVQKRADAAVRQSDTGVSGAVVEIDRVAVRRDGVATREHDVLNISKTLGVGLRSKHPGISSDQAFVRLLEIK